MQCPDCEGFGAFLVNGKSIKCRYCNGTGKIETQFDWMKTLNLDEMASLLFFLVHGESIKDEDYKAEKIKDLKNWLSLKHEEKKI